MRLNYPRTMYVGSDAGSDGDGDQRYYSLCLYITGQTDKSIAARNNIRRVCEAHLAGRYDLEIIDLADNPERAAGDRILATPTLLRRRPKPQRRIVGDLSNTEKLLTRLDIPRKIDPR